MSLKQTIHDQCRTIVAGRLKALRQTLQDLTDSAANETKSSAGDKFETGRAMLHIEQDHVRKQTAELSAQQAVLDAIDPNSRIPRIGLGSLVKAGTTYYFLSTALGKMMVDEQPVIALSLQSPLGIKLKGLQAGEPVNMNGAVLIIENVV